MYAIIETGGKQYTVKKNDVICVEKLSPPTENHSSCQDTVNFSTILFLSDHEGIKIGKPYVTGALVTGEILQEVKGEKVISFKYKKRKGLHRKVGHRQKYHKIKITEITQVK